MTVHTMKSTDHAANNVKAGEPFYNSGRTFSGRSGRADGAGRMSAASAEVLYSHADQIDYVILSYSTPIAYRLTSGSWVIPSDTYSVTTAKHLGHVRAILRALGIDTSFPWVPDISAKTGKPLRSKSHREQTVFLPY